MDVANISVTLLGSNESGKTTYMVAMLGSLIAGDGTYSVSMRRRDQSLELMGQWTELLAGEFPPPTSESSEFDFELSRGIARMTTINWLDYRGGDVRDDNENVAALRKRLMSTDSIYLTLDGRKVGRYIGDTAEGAPEYLQRNQRQAELGIPFLSLLLQESIQLREQDLGKEPPSLVLLLTKFDLLVTEARRGRLAGAPDRRILETAVRAVRRLFEVAFSEKTITLVAPTSVGGQGSDGRTVISPNGFRDPLLFSYRCWLNEADLADEQMLGQLLEEQSEVETELAKLDNNFNRVDWQRARDELDTRRRRCAAEIAMCRERRARWEHEAARLEPDITSMHIFRDGEQLYPTKES
jgi:hypothetical protein